MHEPMGKNKRVIDMLRKEWPDLKWCYDARRNIWENDAGWYVYPCSSIADAEQGIYRSHYRRSDKNQEIYFLPSKRSYD